MCVVSVEFLCPLTQTMPKLKVHVDNSRLAYLARAEARERQRAVERAANHCVDAFSRAGIVQLLADVVWPPGIGHAELMQRVADFLFLGRERAFRERVRAAPVHCTYQVRHDVCARDALAETLASLPLQPLRHHTDRLCDSFTIALDVPRCGKHAATYFRSRHEWVIGKKHRQGD